MFKKYFTKSSSPRTTKSFDMPSFAAFMDHGQVAGLNSYQSNVIVYRCVNLVAQSASHVPWIVMRRKNGIEEALPHHPLHKLLRRPNPKYAGADFFMEAIASMLLFGNAYILGSGPDNAAPRELHLLSAKYVDIVLDNGRPKAYRYRYNGGENLYPINSLTSMSKVLHLKTYNPHDQIYGMSSLDAASVPIETHSQASKWNNALLKNGARPSGALVMKDGSGYLSDEQFERIKEQLYDKYTGASNSGKPLLLEGGLDWREMSISPKDMDFIESKNSAAREIALAFGVPPQLLGISGDNTYSNMQEARLGLWEETLIPLLDKISDALTHWLSDWYHDDIAISFDRDAISALTSKRENLWSKVADSNFMTINEKRAFVGLKAIKGGDVLDNTSFIS
ncbi:MAG: phage portal protein [Pseudomonadota bacterium]